MVANRTLRSTGGPTDTGRRLVALLCVVGLVAVALLAPTSAIWLPMAMLLLPATAAWIVRRDSLIVTIYLAQVTIYYGLTWLILQPERPPGLVSLVITWCAGITIGCLAGRPARSCPDSRIWRPPSRLQFGAAIALLSCQVLLIVSGKLGYEAQLAEGQTTPTGLLGTAATAAPVITLLVLISAIGSGRRQVAAGVLAVTESIVLSFTGFRGAGVLFVIAGVYIAVLVLPMNSVWRQPRRLMVIAPAVLLLVVIAFMTAAQIKSDTATNYRNSSAGTALFGANEAITTVATRLDFGDPLQRAITLQDDAALQEAVLWSRQLGTLVPRLIWPDKPVGDYGQRVTAVIYGLENSRSSATITVIGDSLVNFGWAGVLLSAVFLGGLLRLLERRIRLGSGWLSLVLAASLCYTILSAEVSVIAFLISLLRTFGLAALIWGVTELTPGGGRWQPKRDAPPARGARRSAAAGSVAEPFVVRRGEPIQ